MVDSGVRPIHNLKVDSTILIDVIIFEGALNVRLIDYRSHHNQEFFFKDKNVFPELPYPKGIKQLISNGFKYCRPIARLLTLHNLSAKAKKIKEQLEENASLNVNTLSGMTAFPESHYISH